MGRSDVCIPIYSRFIVNTAEAATARLAPLPTDAEIHERRQLIEYFFSGNSNPSQCAQKKRSGARKLGTRTIIYDEDLKELIQAMPIIGKQLVG